MNDVICIDTSRFSKQRQLVMGIAALMIYFAHAYAIVPVDGVIAKLLSLGNLGVDIFLFASGFGMYYSLRNGGCLYGFVKRRGPLDFSITHRDACGCPLLRLGCP